MCMYPLMILLRNMNDCTYKEKRDAYSQTPLSTELEPQPQPELNPNNSSDMGDFDFTLLADAIVGFENTDTN